MDAGNLAKTIGPNLLWKVDGKPELAQFQLINDLAQILVQSAQQLFPVSNKVICSHQCDIITICLEADH